MNDELTQEEKNIAKEFKLGNDLKLCQAAMVIAKQNEARAEARLQAFNKSDLRYNEDEQAKIMKMYTDTCGITFAVEQVLRGVESALIRLREQA